MESLTELYNQALVPMDQELEKQAAELYKQAEEEDAAGRIMARGFADELNKLAQPAPNMGGNVGLKPRTSAAPAVKQSPPKVTVGSGTGIGAGGMPQKGAPGSKGSVAGGAPVKIDPNALPQR